MKMAKIGSYRWEGREKILRSLEKAAKVEIAEAQEEDETVTIHPLTSGSRAVRFIP